MICSHRRTVNQTLGSPLGPQNRRLCCEAFNPQYNKKSAFLFSKTWKACGANQQNTNSTICHCIALLEVDLSRSSPFLKCPTGLMILDWPNISRLHLTKDSLQARALQRRSNSLWIVELIIPSRYTTNFYLSPHRPSKIHQVHE